VLSVASSGSSGPVDITVSPADDDGMGGGTTPFTRGYPHGAQISLGAPSVSGRSFLGWQRDGSPFASTASVLVALDGDASFTAVYHDPAAVRMTNLKVSGDAVHLGWSVRGGFSYIVEASPDPSQGFQAISGPLPVEGGEDQPLEFTEPAAAMMPRRFYRLRIVW
jgi:hypothetical protein